MSKAERLREVEIRIPDDEPVRSGSTKKKISTAELQEYFERFVKSNTSYQEETNRRLIKLEDWVSAFESRFAVEGESKPVELPKEAPKIEIPKAEVPRKETVQPQVAPPAEKSRRYACVRYQFWDTELRIWRGPVKKIGIAYAAVHDYSLIREICVWENEEGGILNKKTPEEIVKYFP